MLLLFRFALCGSFPNLFRILRRLAINFQLKNRPIGMSDKMIGPNNNANIPAVWGSWAKINTKILISRILTKIKRVSIVLS